MTVQAKVTMGMAVLVLLLSFIISLFIDSKPTPSPIGELNMDLYHVLEHVTQITYHHASFDAAINAHGFTAEPPLDVYTLTFDGSTEWLPYVVTYGEQGGINHWFTDYADESPSHNNFPTDGLMNSHLKHIDDLAHGLL